MDITARFLRRIAVTPDLKFLLLPAMPQKYGSSYAMSFQKGPLPIAHSLELGGGDFPAGCEDCRNIIILITDGVEACDGDACAVSLELQRKGIILKPFVIGIGIDENFRQTFNCIGRFYNAAQEEKFGEIMDVVISQALNATTAQVNLLDINGNPTETNVNLTFYDSSSGQGFV